MWCRKSYYLYLPHWLFLLQQKQPQTIYSLYLSRNSKYEGGGNANKNMALTPTGYAENEWNCVRTGRSSDSRHFPMGRKEGKTTVNVVVLPLPCRMSFPLHLGNSQRKKVILSKGTRKENFPFSIMLMKSKPRKPCAIPQARGHKAPGH